MNQPVDLSVYKETLLFLVTAGVVAPLFFRLRISPVLGYLLAGVALGPYGLGSIDLKAPWLNALAINVEAIDRIAAFGVVALMFTMGLELSFQRLRRMRHLVFGLGLAQVVVTTLILGAAAWRLGFAPPSALAIGAALSMSSTAIVIPMLVESKRLHSSAGRASLAVLLFQDLAVAPLLVMVGAFSAGGERGTGMGASQHARPGRVGAGRADRLWPPRLAALLPFRRRDEEPGILHGGVPAGGAGRWVGRRGEPFVDGAGRLRRRASAGGDRISSRDRADDRAVPGAIARALLRLGRRRDQSSVHRRAARPHSWSCHRARGGEGPDAVCAGTRLPSAAPPGCRNVPPARAGRRVRLRDDRRRAGGWADRPHAGDDAHQRGGDIDACDPGAGEARRAHRLSPAGGRGHKGAGSSAGERVVPRHHCRLRPRRRADRRHARPARNPVHRGRLRTLA